MSFTDLKYALIRQGQAIREELLEKPLRWLLWFGVAVLAYKTGRLLSTYVMSHLTVDMLIGYPYLIIYGAGALFGCALLLLLQRIRPTRVEVLGSATRRQWTIGLCAVLVCYSACYAATFAAGYGREPVMMTLGLGMTHGQYLWMLASLILLPPIVEEIAFRHFLLMSLPVERSTLFAGVSVIVTATIFYKAHGDYIYVPTQMLMLALGLVFGWGRIASGGLLLPIGLHAFAEVVALSVDAVWKNAW